MNAAIQKLLSPGNRNQELDFMRGIAILVVMLRHNKFTEPIFALGTTGVQLFFVLSGFLVGGLIWKELKNKGEVKFKTFVLRRGFKIWPQFYVFVIINLGYDLVNSIVLKNPSNIFTQAGISGILSELFFVQNYVDNLFDVTWSLAVEEHFYLVLPFILVVLVAISPKTVINKPISMAIVLYALFLITCLTSRILAIHTASYEDWLVDRQSQLHLDALFFGVLLAAFNTYKKEAMLAFFNKNSWLLLLVSIGLIVAGLLLFGVPKIYEGITFGLQSGIGYTLLYWGFGMFTYLLYAWEGFAKALKTIFAFGLYRFIAWTGFYSYSLYLYHCFLYNVLENVFKKIGLGNLLWLNFVVGFIGTYVIAVFLTETLEAYFLKIRDKILKPTVQ